MVAVEPEAGEIEVLIVQDEPGTTRVELSHRHIERHDMPEDVRRGVDSPSGWAGVLANYALSVV